MSFWQKHGHPTLHNAVGTIIGSILMGLPVLLGLIKPTLLMAPVPLWALLLAVGAIGALMFAHWFTLRKRDRLLHDVLGKLVESQGQVNAMKAERATKEEIGDGDLDTRELDIILLLFKNDMPLDAIVSHLNLPEQAVRYFLTRLLTHNYIGSYEGRLHTTLYQLDQRGRAFVVENGLV